MAGFEWCPCCRLRLVLSSLCVGDLVRLVLSGARFCRLKHNSTTQSQAPDDGYINPLTPNDPYMCRTAPLTSKCCILYIYSTNIGTEYFKHALYSPFFSLQNAVFFHNANLFGSCIIHILYTGCAKI